MHEAQIHEQNAFITLTYNEHLQNPSLNHRDFQLFIKRLRKKLSQSSNKMQSDCDPVKKISYYMAGEYGSQNRRPHFHACIFGHDFTDKIYYKRTSTGSRIYTSTTLEKLWGHGYTSTAEVTFESAAYIARYIMDKKTGHNAKKYYEHIDDKTGEITDLKPEYNRMSIGKDNAIGKKWIERYEQDAYPNGEILTRKIKMKTPKYYDKWYKKKEPDKYEEMKMNRELQALEYTSDNTPQRLQAKERVKTAQINNLLRKL